MNILLGIVLGVTIGAIADSGSETRDPVELNDLLWDSHKNGIAYFFQTFKKTPSNKKWYPKSRLCYDPNYPWVVIPCDMIPRSFLKSRHIKKELKDNVTEIVEKQPDVKPLELTNSTLNQIASRMFFSNVFNRKPKGDDSKKGNSEHVQVSNLSDDVIVVNEDQNADEDQKKSFESLLKIFPKACAKEKDVTNCQFKDHELDILNSVTKITKKIYVIKKKPETY